VDVLECVGRHEGVMEEQCESQGESGKRESERLGWKLHQGGD